MRRPEKLVFALLAALASLDIDAAEAQNTFEICRALAEEANRVGPALGERNIYEIADALTGAVPAPMRYSEPREAKPGEVDSLVGCADWDACEALYGDTLEGLVDNDSGPWRTHIVDTRPARNEVFVFTAHSGIFRSDELRVFEQQPDKRLKMLPLGFSDVDAVFDMPFAILIVSSSPYVVILPSSTNFIDLSGYAPNWQSSSSREVALNLRVHDPLGLGRSCVVTYRIAPRSTVGLDANLNSVEPPPSLRTSILAFLDRNLDVITSKMQLGSTLGERVYRAPIFTPSPSASGEMAKIQALLSDSARKTLHAQRRALAKSVFSQDWERLEIDNPLDTWETRWFPVEIDQQGYLGLLLRTGPFAFNPKIEFDTSVVALFSLDAGEPEPVAAFGIQSVFHFTGAQAQEFP